MDACGCGYWVSHLKRRRGWQGGRGPGSGNSLALAPHLMLRLHTGGFGSDSCAGRATVGDGIVSLPLGSCGLPEGTGSRTAGRRLQQAAHVMCQRGAVDVFLSINLKNGVLAGGLRPFGKGQQFGNIFDAGMA